MTAGMLRRMNAIMGCLLESVPLKSRNIHLQSAAPTLNSN
jgi:hypothetical protein